MLEYTKNNILTKNDLQNLVAWDIMPNITLQGRNKKMRRYILYKKNMR